MLKEISIKLNKEAFKELYDLRKKYDCGYMKSFKEEWEEYNKKPPLKALFG